MRILLIQPNSRYCTRDYINSNIPQGLLYVAAALREAGLGPIGLLDARMERLSRKALVARVREFRPDAVGMGGMTFEADEIKMVAGLVKKEFPACKVVCGGPHASSAPEDLAADPNIDFVVIGEGENTAKELFAALEKGLDTSAIAGLAFKDPGGVTRTRPRELVENLDSLPLPAWDLLDLERYFSLWTKHSMGPLPASERAMTIITSRGCPYGCIYCHKIFGRRTRFRSPESVLAEMEILVKRLRVEEIEIADDIFNLDLPRAKAICDGMVSRGLKVFLSFPNGLRSDRMDEELVLKMRAAGTYEVAYAIETATPRLQKLIGKNLDLEKARHMVRFTDAQGINVRGFFMLGFPGETAAEMRATVDFALNEPFLHADILYVTPRPNTPLFELAKKIKPDFEKAKIKTYFTLSYNLSAASDLELKRIMDDAWTDFYNAPRRVVKLIRRVRNYKYILKIFLRAVFFGHWA
jgi:anaerobic magnesium-protoporphyrin IX monomethyl ester cyclase